MLRSTLNFIVVLCAAGLLCGCGWTHEDDSHPEVFQTPKQAVAARELRQRMAWQELAISIVKFDRPDIEPEKSGDAAIILKAGGVVRKIDITPIMADLNKDSDNQRRIMRKYLGSELAAMDRERIAIDVARTQSRVEPMLMNGTQLHALSKSAKPAGSALPASFIVTDLFWCPAVSLDEGDVVPIDAQLLKRLSLSADDMSRQAMTNLGKSAAGWAKNPPYSVIDFPGLGHCGRLNAGVNPATVLLPQFVSTVRQDWKTKSDLVIFLPGPGGVMFVERKDEKLLDRMIPQWRLILEDTPQPLCDNFLVVGDQKPALLTYVPATQPIMTVKPATRSATRAYIVR